MTTFEYVSLRLGQKETNALELWIRVRKIIDNLPPGKMMTLSEMALTLDLEGPDLLVFGFDLIGHLADEFDLDEIIRESNYSFDTVKEKIRDARRVRAIAAAGTSASPGRE